MDERRQMPNSGNLTRDFVDQFFGEETQMGSLVGKKYQKMSEKELNQRLVVNFQRFFKHRDLKLHFLSGMLVKIVPSKDNKLKFSLKKSKYLPQKNDIQHKPNKIQFKHTRKLYYSFAFDLS